MRILHLLSSLLLLSSSSAFAADSLINHEFHGTGMSSALRGGGGKFNGVKISFTDQAEPNRYFAYYQAKEPYEISITDSTSNDLIAEPALLVKRESGGAVDFGGLSISLAVPGWTAGNVTMDNLNTLRLEITLAARAGQRTPIFFEALNSAGKFLLRTALPIEIDNDGAFHTYSYHFVMLPTAEKNRLLKALNTAASTNIVLNLPLTFSVDATGPVPFLAIKKLELVEE